MIDQAQKRLLNSFAKDVVKLAKSKLSAEKGSTKLGGSLDYDLEENEGSFVVSFKMADYGKFVDRGVKGSGGEIKTGRHAGNWGGRRHYINWRGKRKDSPFKFGKSRDGGLTKAIGKWIRKKGIKYKGYTTKTLTMLIARNVYIKGIHGIGFLQTALYKELPRLRENYAIAFKEDFKETAFAALKKN